MKDSAEKGDGGMPRGGITEWLGLGILWYAVIGGAFLLIHKDPSVPPWMWWGAYIASPVLVAVGLALVAGMIFVLVVAFHYGKKLIHDPCPNFWKAIGGSVSAAVNAPFAFLEAEARKADDAREWKTAKFYRGFQHALFSALLLSGALLLVLLASKMGL